MPVFTFRAVVDIFGTKLNIVDRHVERATFQNLTETQPVFLISTEILLYQNTAYIVVVSTERLRSAAIAVLLSKLRKLMGMPQGSLFR